MYANICKYGVQMQNGKSKTVELQLRCEWNEIFNCVFMLVMERAK